MGRLKGYVTNTALTKEDVIENYGHLWKIEKAFRVAKTDLKISSVFHYAKRRIEAISALPSWLIRYIKN